jgi:hypothetical protein
VPTGGSTGQVLSKINATDYNTQWTTPAAGGGVTSVTGTAPVVSSGGATPAISMAAATTSVPGYLTAADWNAFNGKAPLASPAFTGNPTAPTPTAGDNDTSVATTAFVTSAIATQKTTDTTDFVNVSGDTMTGALNGTSASFSGNITAGSLTSNGTIWASQNFTSTTGNLILATTGAGGIYLRPNGAGSTTGQTTIDSAGAMTVNGNIAAGTGSNTITVGSFSATGATDGKALAYHILSSSRNTAAAAAHVNFHNTNNQIGSITTNASATSFNTASDERLKDFIGVYDPAKAIAIIRADPVRDFNWKVDGLYAVGWGAQTSYAVSEDLASPGDDLGLEATRDTEGFEPWGVDQSKRTPYLWAALAWALDRIDDMEARLAALEARVGPAPG